MSPRACIFVAAVLLSPLALAAQNVERIYGAPCERGDLSSCVTLGLAHETGFGVDVDASRAEDYYEQACDGGLGSGCTSLGLLLARGTGRAPDPGAALALYRRGCDLGERLACDLRDVALGGAETAYAKAGRVADLETGTGLGEAIVAVPGLGIRVVSDVEGRVDLGRLTPGVHRIVVERAGYERLRGDIDVPGNAELLLLMPRADVDDATERGTIAGRVFDEDGAVGLANVEVAATDGTTRTLTDAEGRFELTVSPGYTLVEFTFLGRASRTVSVVVQSGSTVQLSTTMTVEPIALDAVEVTVRDRWLEINGFYRREAAGWGTTFDRAEIDRRGDQMVVDVFRGVPGLIVIEDAVMSTRARAVGTSFSGVSDTSNRCAPTVFTDGVTPPNRDLGSMGSEEVEAIEVYWGLDIPEEYRRPGESPCAVILLWTAR